MDVGILLVNAGGRLLGTETGIWEPEPCGGMGDVVRVLLVACASKRDAVEFVGLPGIGPEDADPKLELERLAGDNRSAGPRSSRGLGCSGPVDEDCCSAQEAEVEAEGSCVVLVRGTSASWGIALGGRRAEGTGGGMRDSSRGREVRSAASGWGTSEDECSGTI